MMESILAEQNNQKVLYETHFLSCDNIGNGNDNCKCLEPKHHVGAFEVAIFLGLTGRRNDST